jgi:hypothetical protein
MYRGSSGLLQHSMAALIPAVRCIVEADSSIWEIDVDSYGEENVAVLLEFAEELRASLTDCCEASNTLVTKMMLGTFGNVPAFDTNVRTALGALGSTASFGKSGLLGLRTLWDERAGTFEKCGPVSTNLFPGAEPNNTPVQYRNAKILDMVLFTEGERLNRPER